MTSHLIDLIFLSASSMTSWSYQSTNPCTVLVKEKQDGQSPSRDCPPPILSSTDTVGSPQDQPEISSLGNSVGGKKGRKKRQAHEEGVVDVVFDNGDGHEFDPPVKLVEKRILVNISIGMDSGLGSSQKEVYQLQVAIPLPEESKKFYAYDVGEHDADVNVELDKLNETTLFQTEGFLYDFSATPDDFSTSFPSDESSTSDDIITSSTYPEGLKY